MNSAGWSSISSIFEHGLQDGYLSLNPHVNPRLTGEGAFNATPVPNIRDSSKTNSVIDVKLGRPFHTTI